MNEPKLKVLSLFAGIGGFDLGLERTGGFEVIAQCEIDPFCRRVLAKHWPNVRQYEDVRTLTADTLRRDGIAVDVICGGFPCQDISLAGRRAGMDGDRSGLWAQYSRLVGEILPQFLIVENTPGLLSLGLDSVLADLASLGYDAEWHCIPASAVGAPHLRDRVWIVAHAGGEQHKGGSAPLSRPATSELPPADADGSDGDGWASDVQVGWGGRAGQVASNGFARGNEWASEPAVGRVAYGVPDRLDRLRALGNAVVPQIPELIGNAILSSRRAA